MNTLFGRQCIRLRNDRARRRLTMELHQAAARRRSRYEGTPASDGAEAIADQLIEVAMLLESGEDHQLAWLTAVRQLVGDRRHSPLHSRSAHVSELQASLYYLTRPWLTMWRDGNGADDLVPPPPVIAGAGFEPRGRGRSA